MISQLSSRHSGWFVVRPRSRQMSASTAPIGRRRTTGSSPVACLGRDLLGCGQASENGIGVDGRTGGRSGGARLARRRCAGWRGSLLVLTGAPEEEPGFERGGALQAAGDAREDQPDIDGAGVSRDGEEVRGGRALLQCGGELLAEVDELVAEEEAGAPVCLGDGDRPILVRIGAVGLGGGGWRGGHERNKNTDEDAMSRN